MLDIFHRPLAELVRGRLTIGVSSDGLAVIRTSGGPRARSSIAGEVALRMNPARFGSDLANLLGGFRTRGVPTQIVLADDLVRLFVATPPGNASRLGDVRAAARLRFQVLFGEATDDWQIAGDWNARYPYLACALPTELHEACLEVQQRTGMIVTSVRPAFVVAFNRWRRSLAPGGWLAVLHDGRLTTAAMGKHGVTSLRSTRLGSGCITARWLEAHVSREALRLNVPTPPELRICGTPLDPSDSHTESISIMPLDAADSAVTVGSPAARLARLGMEGW